MTISREKQACAANCEGMTPALVSPPRRGDGAAPSSRSNQPEILASSGNAASKVHPAPSIEPQDVRPPSRTGGGEEPSFAGAAADDTYELLLAFGDRDVVLEVYCAGQRVARDRAATIRAANDRARDLIEEDRAWRSGSSSP
jgi:hypothetical protein